RSWASNDRGRGRACSCACGRLLRYPVRTLLYRGAPIASHRPGWSRFQPSCSSTTTKRAGAPGELLERLVLTPIAMVRVAVALGAQTPRAAHDLLEALRFLAVGARVEPGCLGCSAWLDTDSTVRYTEEWATEQDMRRRVRSDRFTSL